MANFLVVHSASGELPRAREVFGFGLALTGILKQQAPANVITGPWYHCATFARKNGSGGELAVDGPTQSWLAASGLWFHSAGYGCGAEERLLERFLSVGVERVANELEGFYTIVFGDGRTRQVFVVTDIVGSHHSFMRLEAGVASISASSLVLAGLGQRNLDAVACQELLTTAAVADDRTIYQAVRKFRSGTISTFEEGRLAATRRYWTPAQLQAESIADPDAAVERLWGATTGVVGAITRHWPHPVCDLTAGYDSRLMVSGLLASSTRFSTTVAGPEASADVVISRELAECAGLQHIYLSHKDEISAAEVQEASRFTDGEFDPVEYARVLAVQKKLSADFDISINGHSGEFGRGYGWEILLPRTGHYERLDAHKVAAVRFTSTNMPEQLYAAGWRRNLEQHFAALIDSVAGEADRMPNVVQYDWAMTVLRARCWQGRIASSTHQWWPCATPFLFRSWLETALQIKTPLRRRSLTVRRVLAKYQPALAAYPLEHGYPALPATLNNLHRFLPMLGYYVPAAIGRIARKLHLPLQLGAHRNGGEGSPRLCLWKQPEIMALLEVSRMRALDLFEPAALSAFLDASKQPQFAFDGVWNRLLGIETADRLLQDALAEAHSQSAPVGRKESCQAAG